MHGTQVKPGSHWQSSKVVVVFFSYSEARMVCLHTLPIYDTYFPLSQQL